MMLRIGPEEYEELCHRVGAVVQSATPPDAVVAVISKGDPHLVEIEGRRGLHFPRDAEGRYAGFYPKTAEDAIAQVEAVRRGGAQFLCLPATALWWLDHYRGLAAWLDAHCRVAAREPDACVVYDLARTPAATAEAAGPEAAARAQMRALLDALLPEDALLLVAEGSLEGLSAPGRAVAPLGSARALENSRPTADRPTFVLVPRDKSSSPPDLALEDILERCTEPVALRPGLCDVRRLREQREGSRLTSPKAGDSPSDTVSSAGGGAAGRLSGEAAGRLSTRLERLGLPGQDSSDPAVAPISRGQA